MLDVDRAINANNKLTLLGKKPLYVILENRVYIDTCSVTDKNLVIPEFVYGILSSSYSAYTRDEVYIDFHLEMAGIRVIESDIGNEIIESIKFKDNIKEIKCGTFMNMPKLKKISDFDKVEKLDCTSLFENCYSLINTPKLPDYVDNMISTFSHCDSLKNITNIPKECTKFIDTFWSCESITESPDLPDCTVYMTGMFENCSELKKAPTINEKVINIGSTFGYCYSLEGTLEINMECELDSAAIEYCLDNTATESKGLKLTGNCSFLKDIFDTRSSSSRIKLG